MQEKVHVHESVKGVANQKNPPFLSRDCASHKRVNLKGDLYMVRCDYNLGLWRICQVFRQL